MLIALVLVLQGVFAQPNADPRTLTRDQVDARMWPIVERINRSGWVWTTESCEGHDGGYPLTLGIVTDQPGRFFQLFAESQTREVGHESHDPRGVTFTLTFWERPRVPLGAHQMRLSVQDERQWARARRVLQALAERVSP